MPPKAQTPKNAASGDAPPNQQPNASEQANAGAANDAASPAPPKRLDSINRPSSAAGRGAKAPGAPKPKFVGRRSQAARAELEQAEAKKKAAEAAAAAAEAKKNAREAKRFGYGSRGDRGGRGGRGGRGRGGHMGDGLRQREDGVASGPFSAGQTSSDAAARRSGWSSGGGGGGGGGSGAFGGGYGSGSRSGGGPSWTPGMGGGSGIKREPGTGDVSMGGMSVKMEYGGEVSSDEDEANGPQEKQDIDRLQIIDLTGDDAPQDNALVPVRLTRVPHKDRTIGLTAEDVADSSDAAEPPVTDRKKGKQRAKDVEMTGAIEKPKRPTAYSSSDEAEPHIKEEPMDSDDQSRPLTPDLAGDTNGHDMPSSPESKRKAKAKIKATADALDENEDDFPMPEEPRFQTQAEKDEWCRKYEELREFRSELGSFGPKLPEQPADADGDAAMADFTPAQRIAQRQQEQREMHLYLLQFPPVLPDLTPLDLKPDPENGEEPAAKPDAMDVDMQAPTVVAAKQEATPAVTVKQPRLPSGAVGKLKIHKSGKATLDWGGTSFSMGMGTSQTFLQSVMLAQLPETKPKEDVAPEEQEPAIGRGMGMIRGKFVVTPDWEEMLK